MPNADAGCMRQQSKVGCKRSGRQKPAPAPTVRVPGTGRNEYVWHCQILEQEEHDMMRPLTTF
jgi:FtsP/CotA-like multicopper oxidase with cupredoxin domain